jgi:REP element-mobilizing transposase RayT
VPRKPRVEIAGGIHHVWARGNNKALLFHDDVDREGYLWLLGRVVRRQRWRCLSYCLMDNHMHFLVETPEPNLGKGMQRLHGDFGRGFNRRHDRSGHVFQGRFGSKPVETDEQLWTVSGYIAANPVVAGLCRSPEDWRWSSHACAAGRLPAPGWLDVERLYERFEVWGGEPRARYFEAVAQRGVRSPAGVAT